VPFCCIEYLTKACPGCLENLLITYSAKEKGLYSGRVSGCSAGVGRSGGDRISIVLFAAKKVPIDSHCLDLFTCKVTNANNWKCFQS
jgi:hypothetical protein